MHGSAPRDSEVCALWVRVKGVRTSVHERPCAYVYGTSHALSLCKVPPEAALVAENVLAWLLVVVQCFDLAWCARVRRREELVNRVAVCSFGARQREVGAEEGAKARWAVQIDPRLCIVASSVRRVIHIHTERYLRRCHAKRSLLDEGSQGCCAKEWEGP